MRGQFSDFAISISIIVFMCPPDSTYRDKSYNS
jgi:hypothetical protein